jgi:hypothetical protein
MQFYLYFTALFTLQEGKMFPQGTIMKLSLASLYNFSPLQSKFFGSEEGIKR